MGPKSITIIVLVVLGLVSVVACMNGYFGQNDDQDWQVLQSPFGQMDVRTDSGIYQKQFATAWTYPKVQRVYFSSDVREGSSNDESCKVVFSDKGTASFSTMVLYRTPYMQANLAIEVEKKGLVEGKVANFHRLCKGDISIADATLLARVKEYSRIAASDYNASQSVDSQDEFIGAIRKALKEDVTLVAYGIDVEEVTLSDIVFDKQTLLQFTKQQEAILASKEAEANTIKFEMQKIKTVADYAQKIAEQKGLAEMEMMKQVTDAERDAELARINAAKKVTVANLAKSEAETKANMALAVAEIAKKEALTVAAKNLEVAEFDARAALEEKKAIIAKAEGQQKAIELSGAITETEKVLATIAANRDVQISKNIMSMKVPTTMFLGGNGSGEGQGQANYFNNLLGYSIAQQAGLIPKQNTPVTK